MINNTGKADKRHRLLDYNKVRNQEKEKRNNYRVKTTSRKNKNDKKIQTTDFQTTTNNYKRQEKMTQKGKRHRLSDDKKVD